MIWLSATGVDVWLGGALLLYLPLRYYYFAHQVRILQETSSLSNFLIVNRRKIFLAPFWFDCSNQFDCCWPSQLLILELSSVVTDLDCEMVI